MDLPVEILVKIFENLSHKDLKNASLVSKFWKLAAEDRTLWKNCNIILQLNSNFRVLSCLESPRFSALEKLSLQGAYEKFAKIFDEDIKKSLN